MFLVRFDDACETMKHDIWNDALEFLIGLNIRPIVGVVPFNQDPKLKCAPPNSDFWYTVRQWQNLGIEIAIHGCHHVYHNIDRKRQYLPIHSKSEFAGLPPKVQRNLIEKSLAKFQCENVRSRLFMAPSHSFDRVTLSELSQFKQIKFITDGWTLRPYIDKESGLVLVPQQIWSLKKAVKYGIWTVCFHPNDWKKDDLETFKRQILKYQDYCISFDAIASSEYETKDFIDKLSHQLYKILINLK